jgi:hypothetical protein
VKKNTHLYFRVSKNINEHLNLTLKSFEKRCFVDEGTAKEFATKDLQNHLDILL